MPGGAHKAPVFKFRGRCTLWEEVERVIKSPWQSASLFFFFSHQTILDLPRQFFQISPSEIGAIMGSKDISGELY